MTNPEPVVQTLEGKLRGCVKKNLDGEEFYSFLGVPFAQPPVGELRFMDPQPLEPWEGVRDATKEGERFFQRDMFTTMSYSISGTEDGLHLNVFTKKPIPNESRLNPVMVWIYGGGFIEGRNNTDIYGPEFLMLEDIVLVTINYRVGLLGSLKLEDPTLKVPGNAGIKDQIEALKWVQRNIKSFGGDPNNVTIFGESAGAASVHYLVLSKKSKGLFHKAILQSGCALNIWALGYQYLPNLLKAAGKEDLNEKEALEYLRSLPIEKIFELQDKFPDVFLATFSPKIENLNPNAALINRPIQHIHTGDFNQVPLLIGYTSKEMKYLKAAFTEESIQRVLKTYTPEHCVSMILGVPENDEKCIQLGKQLRDVYGDSEDDKFELLSDFSISILVIASALKHAKKSNSPVYLYKFSLDSKRNFAKVYKNIDAEGALHFDDIGYLFRTLLPLPEKGSVEDLYVRRVVKLWTNFAKYGNPTPRKEEFNVTWEPVHKDAAVNYLHIDKELIMDKNPEDHKYKIWKEIYDSNPATVNYM